MCKELKTEGQSELRVNHLWYSLQPFAQALSGIQVLQIVDWHHYHWFPSQKSSIKTPQKQFISLFLYIDSVNATSFFWDQ